MAYVRWLPCVLLVAALTGCGSDQPPENEANEIINNQLDELVAASHGFAKPSGVDATCVRSEDSDRTYECNGALTFEAKGKKNEAKGKKNSTAVSSPIEFQATVGEDNAVITQCRGDVVYGENRCVYIGVTGGGAAGPAGGAAGPAGGAAGPAVAPAGGAAGPAVAPAGGAAGPAGGAADAGGGAPDAGGDVPDAG